VNIIVEKSPVMMSATLPQLGKAKYDILTKCQSYISMLLISNPKLCYKMNSILQIVTGKLEEKENSTSKELRQESLFQLKKQKTQETNTVVEENEEEEGDEEETIEEVNEIAKKMNELVLEEEEDEEEEEEEELDVETSKLNISHEDEFSEITTECREISTKLIPSKEVLQKKEELRSEIETIMCNITKEKCTAYIYGSSESSFGLKGSDLDLCVRIEGCYLNNDVKAQSQLLQLLHDAIEDGKISKNLKPDSSQLIKSSRVPVVKIKDEKRNLECDVCIDNFLAVLNTRMLKTYSLIDDRLRQLVILIKLWAKNRNIADAANGSLSSYSYALLAIFYLQQTEPPILPSLQALATNESLDKTLISEPPLWNAFDCSYFANLEKLSQYWKPKKNTMSIGELLNGFFEYYLTTFDFSTQQSSVRIGKPLPKKSGMAKIAIEDPFERRDLGKVLLDEVADIIIEEFRRAKTKLSEGAKFNEICEAVDGEKINRCKKKNST
jgi:DNA polymerase sigma